MMNAYLRTGAHMVSPEPGMESSGGGVAAAGRQAPLLHPYSPVSPLAATPGPAAAHAALSAAAAHAEQDGCRPISPSSVCSNGEVGSTSLASPSVSPAGGTLPPSVPRLNLSGLLQQQGGDSQSVSGDDDAAEASFGAALGTAASPDDCELPTARLSPVAAEQQQGAPAAEAGVAMERGVGHVPSPITFCLPGDPLPPAVPKQGPGESGSAHACLSSMVVLSGALAGNATLLLLSFRRSVQLFNPSHPAVQCRGRRPSRLRSATCLQQPVVLQRSRASRRLQQLDWQRELRCTKPAIQQAALYYGALALERRCNSLRCTMPCSTICEARSMRRLHALLCRSVPTARSRRSSAPRCT